MVNGDDTTRLWTNSAHEHIWEIEETRARAHKHTPLQHTVREWTMPEWKLNEKNEASDASEKNIFRCYY